MALLQVEVKTSDCSESEVYRHLVNVGDNLTEEQQLTIQYRIIEAIQVLYGHAGVRSFTIGEPNEE